MSASARVSWGLTSYWKKMSLNFKWSLEGHLPAFTYNTTLEMSPCLFAKDSQPIC